MNANYSEIIFYEKEGSSGGYLTSIGADKSKPLHSFYSHLDYFTYKDKNLFEIPFDGEIVFSKRELDFHSQDDDSEQDNIIVRMFFNVEHGCVVYTYKNKKYSRELTDFAVKSLKMYQDFKVEPFKLE